MTGGPGGGKNRHPVMGGVQPVGDGDPPCQVAGRRHPAGRDVVNTACRPAAGRCLRPGSRSRRPGGHGAHPRPPGYRVRGRGSRWCSGKAPACWSTPVPAITAIRSVTISPGITKAGISADVHPVQRLTRAPSGLPGDQAPHAQEQRPAPHPCLPADLPGGARESLPPEGARRPAIGRVPGSPWPPGDPAGQPALPGLPAPALGRAAPLVELELTPAAPT